MDNKYHQTIIKINGKTYHSLEEVPKEIRKFIDEDGNGVIDLAEKGSKKKKRKNIKTHFSFQKTSSDSSKQESINPNLSTQGLSIKNKIGLLVFLGGALYLLYSFVQATFEYL